MRLGVDLDNTIACYDGLFHRLAIENGLLSGACGHDKQSVRDHLQGLGRREDWTRLQGIVYGREMRQAVPFPGVKAFFEEALRRGWSTYIVSHRTRYPHLGVRVDLHRAALDWLRCHGISDTSGVALRTANVYLEETLADKLQRIRTLNCEAFVDDLPELLLHDDFPPDVHRICFDPGNHCDDSRLERVTQWTELCQKWLSDDPGNK